MNREESPGQYPPAPHRAPHNPEPPRHPAPRERAASSRHAGCPSRRRDLVMWHSCVTSKSQILVYVQSDYSLQIESISAVRAAPLYPAGYPFLPNGQPPGHRIPSDPRVDAGDAAGMKRKPPSLTTMASSLAAKRIRYWAETAGRSDIQKLIVQIKMAIGGPFLGEKPAIPTTISPSGGSPTSRLVQSHYPRPRGDLSRAHPAPEREVCRTRPSVQSPRRSGAFLMKCWSIASKRLDDGNSEKL